MDEKREVIRAYFKDRSLVYSQIQSYNNFIENVLIEDILKLSRDQIPEYLLEVYDEVNLEIIGSWLENPIYVEADGSKTTLTPQICRLRGLTYAAPLFIKLRTKIGTQTDEFDVQIARMPIMLKSNKCVLFEKTFEELIELGEDPYEPGGYFIVNGTEKVVVMVEDLALNKFFIENNLGEIVGKMFSERGVYKSLQEIKRLKNGNFTYSFGNFRNIPIFLILKSLGLNQDKDIVQNTKIMDSDIIFQMSEFSPLIEKEDIYDVIAKNFSLVGNSKDKYKRTEFYLDNFIMPHMGILEEDRIKKAKLIAKLFKKYYSCLNEKRDYLDDKDHYQNKRVKLVGQLFKQLFVTNFKDLIVDILTSFQRTIKRGKFSHLKIIVKESLLTQKIHQALALGVWNDGRKGVAQYLKRENYFDTMSHITRIISPLSTSQENFLARELHPTHYGRLCPVETSEGHAIGLRKNTSLMSEVSFRENFDEEKIIKIMEGLGLEKY